MAGYRDASSAKLSELSPAASPAASHASAAEGPAPSFATTAVSTKTPEPTDPPTPMQSRSHSVRCRRSPRSAAPTTCSAGLQRRHRCQSVRGAGCSAIRDP